MAVTRGFTGRKRERDRRLPPGQYDARDEWPVLHIESTPRLDTARFFAWPGDAPALLVGGGSGVVPLMAMLRHARAIGRPDLVRLVVSARSPADLYFAAELPGAETTIVYTRYSRGARPAGRLTVADLAPLVRGGEDVFVCGSPAFCDAATDLLGDVGVPVDAIRVERFGPSG